MRASRRWRRAAVAAATWLTLSLAGCALTPAPRAGGPDDGRAHERQHATPAPAGSSRPTHTVPAAPARRAESDVEAETPTGLVLTDGTGVRVAVSSTRSNGVLDVPDDVRTAGWWDGSARIGDPFGVVLVAAHVDSVRQGLGPFVVLLSVRRGQRLTLLGRGLRQDFEVESLQVVPRSSVAAERDLTRVGGRSRLVLVTCAAPYDPQRGGYQNLAVVTARPMHPPRRREKG